MGTTSTISCLNLVVKRRQQREKRMYQLKKKLLVLYIYVLEKLLPNIIATLIAVVSLAAQEK